MAVTVPLAGSTRATPGLLPHSGTQTLSNPALSDAHGAVPADTGVAAVLVFGSSRVMVPAARPNTQMASAVAVAPGSIVTGMTASGVSRESAMSVSGRAGVGVSDCAGD